MREGGKNTDEIGKKKMEKEYIENRERGVRSMHILCPYIVEIKKDETRVSKGRIKKM